MNVIADGLPDVLLTPQNISLVTLLGLLVAAFWRGAVVSGKQHTDRLTETKASYESQLADVRQQLADERRKSAEATRRWEELLIKASQGFGVAARATQDAVKIAEQAMNRSGNSDAGGGGGVGGSGPP